MMEKLIPYLNRDVQIVFLLAKDVLSQTKIAFLMKQKLYTGLVSLTITLLRYCIQVLLFKPNPRFLVFICLVVKYCHTNIIFDYIRLIDTSLRTT